MKKERKSNIELLRIVAMILIISFHYVYKSNFEFDGLTINSFIVKVFYMFGELGVNLFILITGYFMVTGKFSIKKLICLILEVNFYYLISILIAQKLGVVQLSTVRDYIMIFFPTIHAKYWFITAYIIVYILSPYLNILIQNMSKKEYQRLIIISIVLWSIIPTIFGILYNTTENMLFYSRLIWLIVMYLVGAYIKLHPLKIFSKTRNSMICAISSFTAMLISIIVIYKFREIFSKLGTTEVAYFWPPNTILMFILSISIFEIFLNIKMKSIKIINIMASTTLGIYMIHDGDLQRYIWDTIFKTKEHLSNNTWTIILDIMSATIIIFIVCAIIDLIRQFIEKITVNKILNIKMFDRNKEPIFLEPEYKEYIWGGQKLKNIFNKDVKNEECTAESWEISTNKNGETKIRNGKNKGKTLAELYNQKEVRKEIFGTKCEKLKEFPLLIKFIDANECLSVQVHPDNEYAIKNENSQGKTEMWYILECEEGAKIICGIKEGIDKETLIKHINSNEIIKCLNYIDVQKGDSIYIPAGTIHALLGKTLVAEVQQNSNITYRVYDWGRKDKDGNSRELHIEKALQVINTENVPQIKRVRKDIEKENIEEHAKNENIKRENVENIVKSEFFTTNKINVMNTYKEVVSKESFMAFNVIEGNGILKVDNMKYEINKGDSFILPANIGQYEIEGQVELLQSYV